MISSRGELWQRQRARLPLVFGPLRKYRQVVWGPQISQSGSSSYKKDEYVLPMSNDEGRSVPGRRDGRVENVWSAADGTQCWAPTDTWWCPLFTCCISTACNLRYCWGPAGKKANPGSFLAAKPVVWVQFGLFSSSSVGWTLQSCKSKSNQR